MRAQPPGGREAALARFKERLAAGELLLGMQHNSGSAAIAELVAYAGFDFVIVDMEHAAYGIAEVEHLVRAAEGAGLVAFVRVLRNDRHAIMQVMDAGAQGVLVPHVTTVEECAAAAAALRYAPAGTRGKSAGSRAARWGLSDWPAYERWANAEPLMVPIIEDAEALERLDEILATPGLELVAVGPGDLSQSVGRPGEGLRADPVMEGLERTIALCRPRGIGVMTIPIPDMTPEFVAELAGKGARVVWYGGDLNHIAAHFAALARAARDAAAS